MFWLAETFIVLFNLSRRQSNRRNSFNRKQMIFFNQCRQMKGEQFKSNKTPSIDFNVFKRYKTNLENESYYHNEKYPLQIFICSGGVEKRAWVIFTYLFKIGEGREWHLRRLKIQRFSIFRDVVNFSQQWVWASKLKDYAEKQFNLSHILVH